MLCMPRLVLRRLAVPALSVLLSASWMTQSFSKSFKDAYTIIAECRHISGRPFEIVFDLGDRLVCFMNGPTLKISQLTFTNSGTVEVQAAGPAHDLHASIATTASIRFRNIPGNFDEIVCEHLTRVEDSSTQCPRR